MLFRWKDGLTTWVPLKYMKERYPVQVSEYAVLTRVQEEPEFAWWVPRVLQKRSRIVAKVKSKYWICTHKLGLKVPKSIRETIAKDCDNRNNFWWDSICKEMKNVRIAFE